MERISVAHHLFPKPCCLSHPFSMVIVFGDNIGTFESEVHSISCYFFKQKSVERSSENCSKSDAKWVWTSSQTFELFVTSGEVTKCEISRSHAMTNNPTTANSHQNSSQKAQMNKITIGRHIFWFLDAIILSYIRTYSPLVWLQLFFCVVPLSVFNGYVVMFIHIVAEFYL